VDIQYGQCLPISPIVSQLCTSINSARPSEVCCEIRHPKEGLCRPRTVPTPASQPAHQQYSRWPATRAQLSDGFSVCCRGGMWLFCTGGVLPSQEEGTREETANGMRIWLFILQQQIPQGPLTEWMDNSPGCDNTKRNHLPVSKG
jgi:hypothetical protein